MWLAAAALAFAVDTAAQTTRATGANPSPGPEANPSPNPEEPGSGRDAFVPETTQRTFTATGTVVRARDGQLLLRLDDHGHRIPFQVQPGAGEDLQPGSRVAVTYRPTGATGQAAERVQVLEPARNARGRGRTDADRARREQ